MFPRGCDIKFFVYSTRFRYESYCAVPADVSKPDVVLLAFDRRWPCHRSVLSHSNFFRTLLNGSFREAKLDVVTIRTTDDLINETSFQKLLDLLYGREMNFAPDDIFNVTATAQYFQMEAIVDFCEGKIAGMIKSSNAIDIYHFADRYFLSKAKEKVFQWMLLRLFPVRCWDQLSYLSIDLAEKLIAHPRLVTHNELYLYFVLKMLIQIHENGTCSEENEQFYAKIRANHVPFLCTADGEKYREAFRALRLGNILVRKENVEIILNDNIIPRGAIDKWIHMNWMSLISIESPENFGPSSDLVTKDEFESQAMRFAKIIHGPDFHCWKFTGFSYAFNLAFFFDGRTLIIKRVNQINAHKVTHSHLLRRIMIRWNVSEMNSTECHRQDPIQTFTMTTNEELCLRQLPKEPKYPCRVSVEVLFHVPYKATEANRNFNLMIDSELVDLAYPRSTSAAKTSFTARALDSYRRLFN